MWIIMTSYFGVAKNSFILHLRLSISSKEDIVDQRCMMMHHSMDIWIVNVMMQKWNSSFASSIGFAQIWLCVSSEKDIICR